MTCEFFATPVWLPVEIDCAGKDSWCLSDRISQQSDQHVATSGHADHGESLLQPQDGQGQYHMAMSLKCYVTFF